MPQEYHYFHGGILSNFYPAAYTLDCVRFHCSEQGFMYAKAIEFGDHMIAKQILSARTPAEAKGLARKIKNIDEVHWSRFKMALMYRHCFAKFSQNSTLQDKILATKGQIVKTSPTDRVWGIGITLDVATRLDPLMARRHWRGQNLLGEVLTQVRIDLLVLSHKNASQRDTPPETPFCFTALKTN